LYALPGDCIACQTCDNPRFYFAPNKVADPALAPDKAIPAAQSEGSAGGAGWEDGKDKDLRAPVEASSNPPPTRKPPDHDLDPVAAFVVTLDGLAAQLPAQNSGLYPLLFQRFSEKNGIITAGGEQPNFLCHAPQQRRRAGLITDLACHHEEPDRAAFGVGGDMRSGVHFAFGSTDQAAPLIALRCAFRQVAPIITGFGVPALVASPSIIRAKTP
jgi:hypothetical protein